MISLLLGASTHSFEIVLGVFIAGLALGSLLVKQRIDKVAEPLVLLGSIQVVMGCLAMVSLLAYPFLFEQYIAQWSTEARDTTAYVKHLLFGAGLATALMLPVTICAGMTLPLITRLLMAQRGEASLGIVYAANTIGSIIGVFLAVHVLLTHVGVKNGILIGALADVLLGIGLFAYVGRRLFSFTATSFTTAVLAVTLLFGNIPLQYAAAGVFRHGQAIGENQKIVFYRDGKTASISVLERTNGLKSDKSIRTNGKIDAAIVYDNQSDNYSSDEMTMTMLGLLPLLARPDARTAANIGFGSGLTTRTLLQSSKLQRVDNIEIEPMVIAGAQQMGEKVAPVFSDPRNHFIIDDAKSAFIRTGGKYDIIVSGPSNPWISGVASLFTKEFYRRVRTSLAQDGVFVQWTPLYESSPQLVASIARALSEEFSDFRMYLSSSSDLVIITVADGQVPPLLSAIFADDNAREFFGYYGFHSAPDVEQLFVGDKKHMLPYYESFNTPANSDYFPYLEHHAPLSFFTKTHYIWPNVRSLPVPVMEMAGDWKMSPEAVAALPRSPLANEIASARKLFASLKEENGELIRLINAMQSLSCYSNRHDTTENEEENTVIKRSEHGSDNPESKVDLTLSSTNSEEEENNADMAANNNNGNNAGKYMLSVSSLITRLMPHISRENMLVVWELLEEEGCVAEQLADAGSIAGIYTQFWRALSLRDATTLADTTQELFSYSDFNTQSGQIVLLSAMAAQYQLGNYSRVLSLINQLPLVNPTIHHATRFIAAQAATKI
jgi:spermidine synthase